MRGGTARHGTARFRVVWCGVVRLAQLHAVERELNAAMARQRTPRTLSQLRARIDELSARRSTLTRRLASAAAATESALQTTQSAQRRLTEGGCAACAARELSTSLDITTRLHKRLYAIRRRLEAVVDELEWIARQYALCAPSPGGQPLAPPPPPPPTPPGAV